MRFCKFYLEHLTQVKDSSGFDYIIKGSESMERYPHHQFKNPCMGILTFGTQKVRGVTCIKVSADDAKRTESLGWNTVKIATHYAFILPPGLNA